MPLDFFACLLQNSSMEPELRFVINLRITTHCCSKVSNAMRLALSSAALSRESWSNGARAARDSVSAFGESGRTLNNERRMLSVWLGLKKS
jgi:hypothetical protein